MKFIEDICQKIVSPIKIRYSPYDLGSSVTAYGRRQDFQIMNAKGYKIHASFYRNNKKNTDKICVIYLHSMNGSRLESTSYAEQILKMGLEFCNFDFSGCGNSEGNVISFGANEKHDILAVIDALRQKFSINKVILWGRSMGSASAIKYCELMQDYRWYDYRSEILGLVLDSCFKSFGKLAVQIGHKHSQFPQFLIKIGYLIIKNTLQEKGEFKIQELELQQIVNRLEIPMLFLASQEDKTVDCEHSQSLFQSCNHPKKKLTFIKGLHNESRDEGYLAEVILYIQDLIKQNKKNSVKTSFKELKINKFQMMASRNRNFEMEGDQLNKESRQCVCSLFPSPQNQAYSLQNPRIVYRKHSQWQKLNVDNTRQRIETTPQHQNFKPTVRIPQPINFK